MVSRSLAPAGFPTALIVSPATSSPGRLQRALRVLWGTLFLARPAPAVTLWPGAAVASLPLHPDGSCPGCPPHLPPECSPLRHVRSWYRSPAPLAQPRDTTSQPVPSSSQARKGHGVLTERQGGDPPPVCRCALPVARGQPSAPLGACARKPMPALPTPAETWKQPRIHREGQEDHTRRRRRLGRTQSGKSEPPGPHACVRWESQDTQKRATRGLRIGFR